MKALNAAYSLLQRHYGVKANQGGFCRLSQCMGYQLTQPFDIAPEAGMVLVEFAVML